MKNLLLAFFAAAGLIFSAIGDEASGGNRGRGPGRGGYGQRGGRSQEHGSGSSQGPRGGMGQSSIFVELELARRFPAEYAEVEALRERYEAALAALAAKGGVTLPESRDAVYRRLRAADPAAFDAAVALMKTSPREGMSQLMALAREHNIELFGGRGGQRPGMGRPGEDAAAQSGSAPRRFNRPDMAALRRKYPEKMREYDELRQRDPAGARQMLLDIIEQDRRSAQ